MTDTPPMTTREKTADHVTDDRKMVADHADRLRKFKALAVEASAARNLDGAESMMVSVQTIYDFITSRNALLSEIAALKGAKWDVQHADTMNDMVLMGMARDEAIDRATQAERQRDELRKALEVIGSMAPSTCETSLAHDMAQFANQSIANQGADHD